MITKGCGRRTSGVTPPRSDYSESPASGPISRCPAKIEDPESRLPFSITGQGLASVGRCCKKHGHASWTVASLHHIIGYGPRCDGLASAERRWTDAANSIRPGRRCPVQWVRRPETAPVSTWRYFLGRLPGCADAGRVVRAAASDRSTSGRFDIDVAVKDVAGVILRLDGREPVVLGAVGDGAAGARGWGSRNTAECCMSRVEDPAPRTGRCDERSHGVPPVVTQ
jgi:hypothetical protein